MATSAALSLASRRIGTALLVPATFHTITTTTQNNTSSNKTCRCDNTATSSSHDLLRPLQQQQQQQQQKPKQLPNIKKRMTSIGRFSLRSQTIQNPSLPTFFVALTSSSSKGATVTTAGGSGGSGGGMSLSDFSHLWNERDIFTRHPRFSYRLSSSSDSSHFEPASTKISHYVKETLHYNIYREDLKKRIEKLLVEPLDVSEKLWEGIMSSGRLGSSGAIPRGRVTAVEEEEGMMETVMLFRAHHVMGDGVSLGAAFSDLADEAPAIHDIITAVLTKRKQERKRKNKDPFLSRLTKLVRRFLCLSLGSLDAILRQACLCLLTHVHPFADFINEEDGGGHRSVSWCEISPVSEANSVAKTIHSTATINDLFVSCVAVAVGRQLRALKEGSSIPPSLLSNTSSSSSRRSSSILPSHYNIVIPVHLAGGIIPPGDSMGNRIGAMVVRVPSSSSSSSSSSERLTATSNELRRAKLSPAPYVGYTLARFTADYLPESLGKWMFRNANANAVAVVSNVKIMVDDKLHWNGRTVEAMVGFVPIPPGVPIGVVVQSYAGMLSISVAADRRAVPDADKFLGWIVEEYQLMCQEASKKAAASS